MNLITLQYRPFQWAADNFLHSTVNTCRSRVKQAGRHLRRARGTKQEAARTHQPGFIGPAGAESSTNLSRRPYRRFAWQHRLSKLLRRLRGISISRRSEPFFSYFDPATWTMNYLRRAANDWFRVLFREKGCTHAHGDTRRSCWVFGTHLQSEKNN